MGTPEMQCFRCGTRLDPGPAEDADAEAEMIASYGRVLDPKDRATLCDDCYQDFREWQRAIRRRNDRVSDWPLPPRLLN